MFNRAPDVGMVLDAAADQFFGNINGHEFHGDLSFVAALRVLLKKRLPEGKSLSFLINNVSKGEFAMEDGWQGRLSETMADMVTNDAFLIVNLAGFPVEEREEILKLLEDDFAKKYNLEYQKDISDYVRPICGMRFHVNDERKAAVVYTFDMNMARYHFFQTLICRAFRPYFKDNPPDEEEKDFVKSAKERTYDAYNRCFKKLADRYDLTEIRSQLFARQFFQNIRDGQMSTLRTNIRNVQRSIENYMDELTKKFNQKRDLCARLLGLETGMKDDTEKDFVDYINRNRFVRLTECTGDTIYFEIRCTLDFLDEDIIKKLRSNESMYDIPGIRSATFLDRDNRKMFMDALMPSDDDPLFKVNLQSSFDSSPDRRVNVHTVDEDEMDQNRIYNPHYQYFHCLGSNAPNITRAIGSGDYITAIEYCIAATRGMDLNEWSQTAKPFWRDVMNCDRPIMHNMETGEDMTPEAALAWLKEKEADKQ